MEGEINNFIMVLTTVIACLCYCHTIAKLYPEPNFSRIFAILPVAGIFIALPLNLTSVNIGGGASFLIGWLASFKLILFAFGNGPLSSSPPLPLSRFVSVACLPIKLREYGKSGEGIVKKSYKSPVNYFTKLILFGLLFCAYTYKDLNPRFLWLLYCLHIYFCLDLGLTAIGAAVQAVAGVELEAPFDDPHLATSLQDFWGRRWNLMVTNILRATVYDPVRSASARVVLRKWASLPAVAAAFFVSGIMHELVFYNIGSGKPSGEVLCFFLIHGACLALEIGIKKALNGKIFVPGFVSGPLSLSFVVLTSFWLFFPPFLRNNADVKVCSEILAFMEFVKHHKLVSSNNITCPYL